jgi:antitoxin component YwqK of YwqJK toxin-antitoxin module
MGYYPNGVQKFQREYQKGIPHGTWIKWNLQGEIIEKQIYENGILIKTIKK